MSQSLFKVILCAENLHGQRVASCTSFVPPTAHLQDCIDAPQPGHEKVAQWIAENFPENSVHQDPPLQVTGIEPNLGFSVSNVAVGDDVNTRPAGNESVSCAARVSSESSSSDGNDASTSDHGSVVCDRSNFTKRSHVSEASSKMTQNQAHLIMKVTMKIFAGVI